MREKARLFGRIFRLGLGIFFVTEVVPVYQAVTFEGSAIRVGWALGLVLFYWIVHMIIQKFMTRLNPIVGAILAFVPFLAVFLIGYGGPAATGALTFIAAALIIAAVRANPGCEVMSIPAMLTRKHTHLACLLFSPVDWFERQFT